jgi:BNR repeat-like domain
MSGASSNRPVTRTWVGAWVAAASLAGWSCDHSGGMHVTPVDTPSAGASQSADPALAIAPGSGGLVVAWIEGDGNTWSLYSSRSSDGGGGWSSPVRVAGGPEARDEVHPHGESSPRLVAGPEHRMALVWPNNIKVPGRKWPAAMLRFARSDDGGTSWSRPITLNDDTTGALVSHQFHGATLVGDSGLAVAWLDEREAEAPIAAGKDGHAEHAMEPDAAIYLASSPDFGRSWSPNRIGWKAACPCCRVSLAKSSDGQAVAAWRKHFPGDIRDVVTATVAPTTSEPERVHPDDWAYAGCPHTGPALATARDGSNHLVWYNGKQGAAGVYYARQAKERAGQAVELVGGQALGVAHPAVATLPDGGVLAAYDVSPDGVRRIQLARLGTDGQVNGKLVVDGSEGGKYPQLAVLSDSLAVVAWTAWEGETPKLRLARVSLAGGR